MEQEDEELNHQTEGIENENPFTQDEADNMFNDEF
jgi:hypothetical protein